MLFRSRLDYDSCIEGDLIEITLDNDEFNELWHTGVLEELNQKLGVIIDDCEDEMISMKQLSLAKEVLITWTKENPNVKILKELKELL